MKRFLSVVLCLLFVLGCVANAAAEEVVELSMLLLAGDVESQGFEAVVQRFNAEHPNIHITAEYYPDSGVNGWNWDAFNQKVITLIAAGMAPDLTRTGVAYVPQFSDAGYFLQLDDYIARDINPDDYMEGIFDATRVADGHIYGVPIGVYGLGLYYNKNMFDAAGVEYPRLSYEDPWTMDEFRAAANALTKGDGANKQYGVYLKMFLERIMWLIYTNGGTVLNNDRTKSTLNEQPVIDAYKYYQELTFKDGISPTATQVKTIPEEQMFISDRLGMLIEGPWLMSPFEAAEGLRFGVAPLPVWKKGDESRTVNFLDQWCVFSSTEHPDECWEALKYFSGYEGGVTLASRNVAGIPINKAALAEMKDKMYPSLSEEEKNVWFDVLAHSRAMPCTANWNQITIDMMKTIDLVAINEMTPEEALPIVDDTVNALLAELNQNA